MHLTLTWIDMPVAPQNHHKGIGITMPKKKNRELKILIVDNAESKEVNSKSIKIL